MFLDNCPPLTVEVGYGTLGTGGNLGYEGKKVKVQRQVYAHALSTHPPARLSFALNGQFRSYHCRVAFNDDVPTGRSHATFSVRGDGQILATHFVQSGDPPHPLSADITGVQTLELLTQTTHWEYAHAVWLDPQVEEHTRPEAPSVLVDCLRRAEIQLPSLIPTARHCIASVVSPRVVSLMDDMLGSLYANGHCQDALVIIFALDPDLACMRLAAKYQAMLIPCRPLSPINAMCKALLYSVAQVINAEKFLCLDSDMLILGDLRPVFAALDACPSGSILTCREGNGQGFTNLHHAYQSVYWGTSDDWENVFSGTTEEAAYPLVVNDGLFAGSRTALLALDGVIRAIPKAAEWSDKHRNNWWRNQFVFNLALARLRCGMELDSTYNVQLHVQEVKLSEQHKQIQADWHGRAVRVLHFSGAGRQKYPAWRGRFARIGDPVVGRSHGDAYSTFLEALRIWVGQNGLASLAWSFYGKTDGKTADVKDISTFALLALLHYLIRTNGCVRVFETGTARGVSAACLASAVAHRSGGQIVSFDPYPHPERTDLWSLLPIEFQNCIEQRAVGSVEGMASAIDAGERYDAALLDSIHTEEHVWDEFQLATRLVCPGGLILIHDVYYIHGTVEAAIQRIKAAGYGVVRLWTAESGVAEDDHLGLAVIENRK